MLQARRVALPAKAAAARQAASSSAASLAARSRGLSGGLWGLALPGAKLQHSMCAVFLELAELLQEALGLPKARELAF